jgi:hypothetical protein
MASRKTYTCFVCQKAGHEVQVYLDGKDDQGHTKYLNDDMTRHTHLGSSLQQQTQEQQPQQEKANPSDRMIVAMLEGLTSKMDQVLKLLQQQTEEAGAQSAK